MKTEDVILALVIVAAIAVTVYFASTWMKRSSGAKKQTDEKKSGIVSINLF